MTNDLTAFDAARAWTIRDALASGRLDSRGRRPHLNQVQRWCVRGCVPCAGASPIVLPSVKTTRERLTMPEWVDWFVGMRKAALVEQARAFAGLRSDAGAVKRARAAMERMRRG